MHHELLKKTESLVMDAGRIMTTSLLNKDDIIEKGEMDYVTAIDIKVQEFLHRALSTLLPGSNVISEESKVNTFAFSKYTWFLDPVDGTTNLMRSLNLSAVSLALFDDGKPAFGLVYNPFLQEMYTACQGGGAFLNGKKIKVGEAKSLNQSVIAFGTNPYQKSTADKVFRITKRFFEQSIDVRRLGAASIDLCYVADGRFDCYFELNLKPWDYAAGMIILQEAGGKITKPTGEPLNVLCNGDVVASNAKIHSDLIELIQSER